MGSVTSARAMAHALLLAARQLARPVLHPVTETHAVECPLGEAFAALVR